MNKLIASTGLVVVGVSSLQASSFYAPAPDLTPKDQAKPWSVSATLQGFYDSNVLQNPDDDIESWGLIVGVGAGLDMAMEQTYLAVRYDYKFVTYFEDDLEDDHHHVFDFRFDHAFTEDLQLNLRDNLAISREPEVIDRGGPITAPTARTLRSDRGAFRNTANADLLYSFTDQYGVGLEYENNFYDYDDDNGFGNLLDRVEQKISIDGRYRSRPDLTFLAGYRFGWVNYQGNDPLPISGSSPDVRNRNSHYGFVGGDYQLSSNLMASARAGFNYTVYPNVPSGVDDDDIVPFVDVNGTWTYREGSYVLTGFKYDLASTDVFSADPSDPTLDVEALVWYGVWAHALTPKIIGKVNWQTQFGEFNGGSTGTRRIDNEKDNLYLISAGVDYIFNEWWKAVVNYSYTDLDSDLRGRSFDRHRINFGVVASY